MSYKVEFPESNDKAIVPRNRPQLRNQNPALNLSKVLNPPGNPLNYILGPIAKGAAEYYGPHLETVVPKAVEGIKHLAKKLRRKAKHTTAAPTVVYKASGEVVPQKYLTGAYYLPTTTGSPQLYNPTTDFKYIKTVTPSTYTMSKNAKKAMSNLRISAPVARTRRLNTKNRPVYRNGSKGVIIRHKELVGPLMSKSTTLSYNANSFVINPGNSGMFNWLSTLAGNFDKYRILKFRASFVSNQPTSTAGRVGLGIDYDSTDPLPADRSEFFSLTHNVETAPWDSLVLDVPFKSEVKFVNSHTVTDSKLIDYGQLVCMADQITTTGTAIILGDIIIEYEVELLEPQQAVYSTASFTGNNVGAFSTMSVSGPAVVRMVPTSSLTIVEFLVPDGYYEYNVLCNDGAGGTPTATLTVHGGTGKHLSIGNANTVLDMGRFSITANDGSIKLTIGGPALSDLETITITVTRVSASVYTSGVAFPTTMSTY